MCTESGQSEKYSLRFAATYRPASVSNAHISLVYKFGRTIENLLLCTTWEKIQFLEEFFSLKNSKSNICMEPVKLMEYNVIKNTTEDSLSCLKLTKNKILFIICYNVGKTHYIKIALIAYTAKPNLK